MCALLRLFQIEFCAPDDHVLLMRQIFVQNFAQIQHLRLALVLDERQHIGRERRLKRRLREQAVEHDLRVGLALQLNDDAHTVAVGFVADVGDALEPLFVDLIGHALDEHPLVDLIGDLRDDDALAVLAEFLDLGAGAHRDASLAGGVHAADARAAEDQPLCREVRPLNVLHEVVDRGLRIVQHAEAGVDDLGQIVRRDVRGHADGDAGRAVDQQVREAAGQHARLLARLVKVRVPVDRVLLEVAEHLVGDLRQSGLRVTVGRRGVAVDGAEVAVAVDEHIAHGKILRQTHERVIDRGVAVRVIPTQHVADAGRGFLKWLVRC